MDAADEFSPRKRNGFWSFLYHHHKTSKKIDNKSFRDNSKISSSSSFASSATTTTAAGRDKSLGSSSLRNKTETSVGEVEDDSSPNSQATASASSFERKVSRSRSVGCGSRSFSSDFFERISTGFGDCTLRMNAMLVYVMAAEGIFAGFFNGWYYKDPHNTLAEMVVPPPVRPPTITKFLKPYVLKMHFTNKFVTAQVIHSPTATVASSASSQEKALRESLETHRDVAAAAKIGKILGERLLLKNIPAVSVHLKREQKYHGKVKAVIDNVVEAGVKLL